jgi:hypothetical protein
MKIRKILTSSCIFSLPYVDLLLESLRHLKHNVPTIQTKSYVGRLQFLDQESIKESAVSAIKPLRQKGV